MTANLHEKNGHENNGADRHRIEELAVLATTRGLDQLTAEEEAALTDAVSKPANRELLGVSEQVSRMAATIAAAVTADELPTPSTQLRAALEAELDGKLVAPASEVNCEFDAKRGRAKRYGISALLLAAAGTLVCLLIPYLQSRNNATQQVASKMRIEAQQFADQVRIYQEQVETQKDRLSVEQAARRYGLAELETKVEKPAEELPLSETSSGKSGFRNSAEPVRKSPAAKRLAPKDSAPTDKVVTDNYESVDRSYFHTEVPPRLTAPAVPPPAKSSNSSEESRIEQLRQVTTTPSSGAVRGERGQPTTQWSMPRSDAHHPALATDGTRASASSGMGMGSGMMGSGMPADARKGAGMTFGNGKQSEALMSGATGMPGMGTAPATNNYDERSWRGRALTVTRAETELVTRLSDVSGEAYAPIQENAFRLVRDEPLSTFSIDVDTASYANVRRFLTGGQLPPKDAVRIEELLNYFSYDYPQPQGQDPFSVNMEVSECPWRQVNRLLRIGLKGRDVPRQERAASNLVFLIDVSGSMQPENKLPLIKSALKMFVQELTENDRVSIVTYAGDAGLKLPSTNGTEQSRIQSTIESLSAGGSTHGSAGIALAYEQATSYFIRGGTNRVILLTDGDLNVGITDDDALVQLIQQKAKTGVFLTVLGVGNGNLKDSKMEKLADHGNGVYAYLDSLREARKVLVEQMSGSLVTIAKDVKFQIEFNPGQVQAYRLIGYENRVLANRDFHDDTKDAGEIGAGHTVTALYELVPNTAAVPVAGEPLKYQPKLVEPNRAEPNRADESTVSLPEQASRELLTLKLRFKQPEGDRSDLRNYPLTDRSAKFGQSSSDFRFASAVAMFGLVLRDSQYRGSATLAAVEEIATSSMGSDSRGYRAEFVDLVRKAEQLK